ncbi:hypothetical protein [Sphaerisporangium fuscum]|nr:hypothetical protein [Sphaerisporangium fuscum]
MLVRAPPRRTDGIGRTARAEGRAGTAPLTAVADGTAAAVPP